MHKKRNYQTPFVEIVNLSFSGAPLCTSVLVQCMTESPETNGLTDFEFVEW